MGCMGIFKERWKQSAGTTTGIDRGVATKAVPQRTRDDDVEKKHESSQAIWSGLLACDHLPPPAAGRGHATLPLRCLHVKMDVGFRATYARAVSLESQ